MNSLKSLYSRVSKIKASVPPVRENITPCLVPPAYMHLFTEQEQQALQELEKRVVPFIRTDSDAPIWQYGGPYLALFHISPYMTGKLVEYADQELSNHEKWFLNRWHHFCFETIHGHVPQERLDHQRRHIFRTSEELVERFLSIDFSRCPKRSYPLDYIGHDYTVSDIEDGGSINWHRLELWYDFAEECPNIVSTH